MSKKLVLMVAAAIVLVFGVLTWAAVKQAGPERISEKPIENINNQPAASPTGNEPQPGVENSKDALPEDMQATTEIDTSDWQTYRNEEYGFEVKYPSTWSPLLVKSEKEVVELSMEFWSPENYQIAESSKLTGVGVYPNLFIQVIENQNDLAFSEWYKTYELNEDFYKQIITTLKVINLPNGSSAYNVEESGFGDCCEAVYFSAHKLFISFASNCLYRLDCEEKNIEKKIINSFQFL